MLCYEMLWDGELNNRPKLTVKKTPAELQVDWCYYKNKAITLQTYHVYMFIVNLC